MGKRIRVQRRGRGGRNFRASTHKRVAPAKYPAISPKQYFDTSITGTITELVHDPGRGSPLSLVKFENGLSIYTVVPEGVFTGQQISLGGKAPAEIGNIIPLGRVPDGTIVCDLELRPGDGGKMAKSSGAYATVVGHNPQGTMIRLPSKRTRYVNDYCLCTVGVISASGRHEKPFLKAGAKFHLMRAKGHTYPRTGGRKMVPACHPFGSSKRSSRRCTTTSHGAPPGQKVGLIAARSPGQKKKRAIR